MDHRSPLLSSRTGHAGEGRMLAHRAARVLSAVALVLISARAAAQGPAAEALFDQGRAALAKGDLDTACARFRASDQLDPAAGTKANLADCEEKRGHLAAAWEAFRGALEKLPAGDERVPTLKKRIATLEPRLPKLTLTLAPGAPAGTVVREGEATIGTAGTWGVPLPLDPGPHHLTIQAGKVAKPLEVTLAEGKAVEVVVDVAAPAEVQNPAPPPVAPAAPAPVAPASSGPPVGPIVLMGVGGAALVVALGTGIATLQAKSAAREHCSEATLTCSAAGASAESQGPKLGAAMTAMLVIGGAALAGGGLWLGLGGKTVAVSVAPTVSGAAWRIGGAW